MFAFFHLLIALLQCVRCATWISCTASQASFWMWKRSITLWAFGNATETILRIESERSRVTSFTFMRSSSSICFSTRITSSNFVPETTATRLPSPVCRVTVGDKRVQLATRQGRLVYGKVRAYVFRKQQLCVGMVKLVPATEAAQRFLVLFLKCMRVYVIECLKRTAGHRGCLHTSLLKKPRTPWSNGCLQAMSRLTGRQKLLPVRRSVHLRRRLTLWSRIGKSVTFTAFMKPLIQN